MKHVKLYEAFLSEKEELDAFGNKKKKKEEVEDPGTVLSNTTGTITNMEVSEANDFNNKGEGWTHPQFKKEFGKLPTDWLASSDKKYSYLKFFKLDGRYFKSNNYGPPGFVDEITPDEVPADLKDKIK